MSQDSFDDRIAKISQLSKNQILAAIFVGLQDIGHILGATRDEIIGLRKDISELRGNGFPVRNLGDIYSESKSLSVNVHNTTPIDVSNVR